MPHRPASAPTENNSPEFTMHASEMQSPSGSQGGFQRKLKRLSIEGLIFSLIVHGLFVLLAGYLVAMRFESREEVSFQSPPPPRPRLEPRKLEMKVRVQQLQKQSARPALAPRLVSTRPSDLFLPEVNKPVTTGKIQRFNHNLSLGIGDGNSAGYGTGIGDGFGVGFFGLQMKANRVCYIIDFSGSMRGTRHETMKRELIQSLEELPVGMEVSLIFFSGPAWVAGEDTKEVAKNWERKGDLMLLKEDKSLAKPKWIKMTPLNRKKLIEAVEETPLTWGTNWKPPFEMMMSMNPPPDAVYFMTDGSPQAKNEEEVLEMLREWNSGFSKKVGISTIAIGDPRVAKHMEQMAADSEHGEFTIVK